MVGSNSTIKDHFTDLQNIVVSKSGFVYIYCSNESPVDVFIDNLQVIHTRSPILEETHYYPFGLEMRGICSKAMNFGEPENKRKFNKGSELQNKEFSDGSGLDWYATQFRSLDPQIGRWHHVDPKAAKFPHISPYAAFNNNPIYYVDPDGRENVPALLWALKNMANKSIPSTYSDPYFAGSDSRWTYKIGTVPDRTVCYESCFMAYMNSGDAVLPTLRTGFTNKNNAFYGRSTTTGGMNWFKSGDGTDRQFVTDMSKGQLGDIVFMGEVGDMQGHAVLLASDITMGTTEIDGVSYETATFYTLSTSSDSESGNYGGREFSFTKQSDGTWKQQGGSGYTFNGFGQMTNVQATDEQKQEVKTLVEEVKKGN